MSTKVIPGKFELFLGFFKCGLSGFGGVLPHARRMLVDDRRWLSDAEFADLLGLGQCLPGPNIVNVSVVVGQRFHGWQGACLAVLGLMGAPLVIVLLLASLYEFWADSMVLHHILQAVAAGAAGLMLSTGAKLASRMPRRFDVATVAVLALLAVAVLRMPLIEVLAVLAPLGLFVGWRATRTGDAQ